MPKAASKYPKDESKEPTNRRGFWGEQIQKSDKKFETFGTDGDQVMDRFMLESRNPGDKYNILYSSTETIKPSLYGQTPKVEVKNKQQDTDDSIKVASAMMLEAVGQYCVDEVDFDYVMKNAVSDYVLPGLGTVWVRYDPKFAPMYDNDNKPETYEDGSPKEYKTGEKVCLDYVYWKDMRWGEGRVWEELPWIARRVYFTEKKAAARFGKEKAAKLSYSYNQYDRKDRQNQDNPKKQAIIWEIWDKENREVLWYSEEYPDDVLDLRQDPLKLRDFYPCPRPLRAVWTTRDFIPKALYSQYKAQAAELDRLTERIRYLTEALKVRGLYDGSQEGLVSLLEGPGNKMVPIQDWAQFIGQGGVANAVQWVPLQEIVNCLTELFKQREIAKNEIYEITGFSDIVRGVSKASETLGAQQIKSDWATGRLKDMQREVQRFCRDAIRLMTEVAAEHFSDKTMLLYSGLKIPEVSEQEKQAQQQYQMQRQQYPMMVMQAQAQGQQPPPPPQEPPPTQRSIVTQMFQKVLKLIKSDPTRCAALDIETDSTILPDEQKEREDRMQFLSSMGAFLQQAAPLALQFPDMRGLLGGIMMFTLRTFSASRPLEKEFEEFQKKLAQMPPTPPPGEGGDNGEAAAQGAIKTAEIKAQADQAKTQADGQMKKYEVDQRTAVDKEKNQQDHDYRMAQLALERQKVDLERQKLGLQVLGEERQADAEESDRQYQREVDQQTRQDEQIGQALDRQEGAEERDDARLNADRQDDLANRQQDLAERAQSDNTAVAKDGNKIKEKAIKAKPAAKPSTKK